MTRDSGSTVLEFVLVGPLVVAVMLAVVQACLLVHARNVLVAAAESGARAGAVSHGDVLIAGQRARLDALDDARGPEPVEVTARVVDLEGIPVMAVTVAAEVPLLGMLATTRISVEGRALVESS